MPKSRAAQRIQPLVLAATLFCTPLAAESPQAGSNNDDGFWNAFTSGEFKALIRYNAMYRDSSLHMLQDGSDPIPDSEKKQQYSAFGGYFGYETAPWFNTTFGATVYTSQPIGNNPDDRRGLGGLYEADGGQDGYTALGELFARWQYGGHRITAGRQEMPAYRMVSMSNIRMTPVTHSGIAYDNTVFDDLKFSIAGINRMKERNDHTFIDMASGARLKDFDRGKQIIRGDYNPDYFKDGVYVGPKKEMLMAGAIWQPGDFSLEAWNYYIGDFVNSLYLYGDYSISPGEGNWSYTLAAQYTDQSDVGDRVGGDIDTWHWGLKLSAGRPGMLLFAGYNEVAYNEASYDGGTLFVRWGTPQMFNSFQVQDSELAGTKSWGVGWQYDLGLPGLVRGTVIRFRYADYNMPDDLTMTDARQDRAEATFDLRYSFMRDSGFGIFTEMDGLSIQFRAAWNNYDTSYDFEAYREIHGYEFESVTKDFWDLRLYLDYHF